jgi:small neutral amino acid transporter SnatA (MarC family)
MLKKKKKKKKKTKIDVMPRAWPMTKGPGLVIFFL